MVWEVKVERISGRFFWGGAFERETFFEREVSFWGASERENEGEGEKKDFWRATREEGGFH